MGKIHGDLGQVFICYKDDKPTFNIVTNGNEAAFGGKDDGIYEYRQLTHEDMMNGEILDQMAQKNTLVGWEKFVNKSSESSANTPPPSHSPSPGNKPPPGSPISTGNTPPPGNSPPPGNKPPPGSPTSTGNTPPPDNSPPSGNPQLTNDERKSLVDLMGQAGVSHFDTDDLKAISNGKFRDVVPSAAAVSTARKLTADDNALAREIDQKGNKDGWLTGQEINPSVTSSSAWTENHSRDVANLMQKADVDRLSTADLNEISNGNWSKYGGPLSQKEIDAAKILVENGNSRVREIDNKGNTDGFLQVNELVPGSTNTPNTPNTPPRNIDPKNVSSRDIINVYPQTGGANGTTPFTHLVNDIKSKSGTDQLYLRAGDVKKAMDLETDPNKRAIYEWVYSNFNRIDNVKETGNPFDLRGNDEDGLIGAGDLEKYFGWTK